MYRPTCKQQRYTCTDSCIHRQKFMHTHKHTYRHIDIDTHYTYRHMYTGTHIHYTHVYPHPKYISDLQDNRGPRHLFPTAILLIRR